MTRRSQLAELHSLVCRPRPFEPRSRGTLRQGGIIIRLLPPSGSASDGCCLPPPRKFV